MQYQKQFVIARAIARGNLNIRVKSIIEIATLRLNCSAEAFARNDLSKSFLACYFPILNILVPQTGQTPWVAGLPFFMVTLLAVFISCLARHFTQ
jgi:hypothetical protein